MRSEAAADLVLRGGKVITLDGRSRIASAIAVRGETIAAAGSDAEIAAHTGPETELIELGGAAVIPGLIDGHAHLDREGLKHCLPSLAGIDSIEALVERLAALARDTPAGQWIITMPLGEPPEYRSSPATFREGRMPSRHDLDRASTVHPILIRPPWGYWSRELPLVGVANSRALELAGIDRSTRSPSPLVEIERDAATGELTGRILEQTYMPIAEFTLFRMAPGFTASERVAALVESMRRYNAVGTTSVFEGHGVAPEVINAYQKLHERGALTVRARLVFSPAWSAISPQDVATMLRSWAAWVRGKGLGDTWLRLSGIYTEIDDAPEGRLRASCAPQTGWAGFCYDAGLPRDAVKALLVEAARNGIRVCGIYADLLELFAETDRIAPIGGQRWILGHQATLDDGQVARIRDLGIALTLHTNAHIYKRGDELRSQLGAERERHIVPVRTLLDAGIVTALSTDNVPISMFHPIWQTVARVGRKSGTPIAPQQAISREEALRCATQHGAMLSFEEDRKGSIEPGKLADFAVLDADPLTVPLDRLREIGSRLTVVGGKIVHRS